VPREAIESIEPVFRRLKLRGQPMAVMLWIAAICLLLVGLANMPTSPLIATSDRVTMMLAIATVCGIVAAFWTFLPGRQQYGWLVKCFHRGDLCVWFNSPRGAEKYRVYFCSMAPDVPFLLRREPARTVFFWWIDF
jgi:hypothetical protein